MANPDLSGKQDPHPSRTRTTAWGLALSGFLPFAVLTVLSILLGPEHPSQGTVVNGLATYGAVILSFLGGIRWGLALNKSDGEGAPLLLILSVVPSLIGWFSLLLPVPQVFAVMALAFAGQGIWDHRSARQGQMGDWFAKLRLTLTILVTSCLTIAAVFVRASQ